MKNLKLKIVLPVLAGMLTLSVVLIASCQKDGSVKKETPAVAPNVMNEKANTCSCYISGFWGSCMVTCPVKHGVCLATCTRVSIWGGLLGSAVTCTCGGAGAGHYVVSDGIYYDDINKKNLQGVERFVHDHPDFVELDKELDELLQAIRTDYNLVAESQDFFDKLNGLSAYQVQLLNPVIADLIKENGRE